MATGQVSIARKSAYSFVHRHRWLPMVAALIIVAGYFAAVRVHATSATLLAVAACGAATLFAWGYAAHAFRQRLWAPLNHLSRRQYRDVWDSLMDSQLVPRVADPEATDEEDLGPSTAKCLENLKRLAGVSLPDDVVEIGCGAGRIGAPLAPLCRSWVGADISANMLARASERLSNIPNARLVQLSHTGLREFKDNSFDVAYCTSVFGHLDEMDRWQYIREALRVLRPGGRLLVDNIDVESDAGWRGFLKQASLYQDLERPPFMPRFSTAAELMNYARRAGFVEVRVARQAGLVVVTAIKARTTDSSSE
jgi:ubiquinone/menaquinone biosynthesis C-methylase UbiE